MKQELDFDFELTEEELEVAKIFARDQQEGSKDNVGTRFPTIHVVQRPVEIPASPDEYDYSVILIDGEEFLKVEAGQSSYDTLEAVKKEFKKIVKESLTGASLSEALENIEELDEYDIAPGVDKEFEFGDMMEIQFRHVPVRIIYSDVAFFMIKKKAEEYMVYQKHNLPEGSRIYTYYAPGYGGRGDMIQIASILTKIGKQVLRNEEHKEAAIKLYSEEVKG